MCQWNGGTLIEIVYKEFAIVLWGFGMDALCDYQVVSEGRISAREESLRGKKPWEGRILEREVTLRGKIH